MANHEVTLLTGQAITTIGLLLDIGAIGWLALDWRYSRYDYKDWRKLHQSYEAELIKKLQSVWSNFGTMSPDRSPDWKDISQEELDALIHLFPKQGEAESSKERRLAAVTDRFGVGPNDDELYEIRNLMDSLSFALKGWRAYRDRVRGETIKWAFGILILGLLLQVIGSWPDQWWVATSNDGA